MNESSSIDSFKLPNAADDATNGDSNMQGATWRWVDKTWRLDLTNDGAITLSSSKRSKQLLTQPTMKGLYIMIIHGKPSTEDTFSKYTRRRRWIRTAELIFDNKQEEALESSENVKATGVSVQDATTTKKVKSLRFAEDESNVEESADTDKKND